MSIARATMVLLLLFLAAQAPARINVVTLPGRDSVQLTIYNSVDLTLVRETRLLTFKKGLNRLEFSWANTSRFKRSEEHTSELQSHVNLVCRLLLEKKKTQKNTN